MDNKSLGSRGEEAAAVYLMRHGYEILERNFRVSTGEIDIVAVTGDTLVFAEVKTRRSGKCGQPAQAVDYRKQQKIIMTAKWYLRQRHLDECPCRFDVLEVYARGETCHIRHLAGAFEA
jgi:putative endonuclease